MYFLTSLATKKTIKIIIIKKNTNNRINITKMIIKSFLTSFKLLKIIIIIIQITSTKISPKYILNFHTSTTITKEEEEKKKEFDPSERIIWLGH
jgi:hypothetical protein